MKRSKKMISVTVGLVAVFIIWWVGVYPPVPQQTADMRGTEVAAGPNVPGEIQKAGDANEPEVAFDVGGPGRLADANEPGRFTGRRGRRRFADANEPRGFVVSAEPNEPGDPNVQMESVNLKAVEMKDIIDRIAKWTGKVIIPTDEAMRQRVTIYAPERLPRKEALAKIYSALRLKGYIVEEVDGTIFLKPIADVKLGRVPTVSANEPLALIENKEQVVQKFFELTSYSPSEMGTLLQSLIGAHGHVSVDEATGTLMVIDTVANLMRLEQIIQRFDVPEAEQAKTAIFEVRHGDPSEIVQMLNILLGESEGYSTSRANRNQRDFGRNQRTSARIAQSERERANNAGTPASRQPTSTAKKTDSKSVGATSVVTGATKSPIILIPEPRRKWIIAKASAEDLEQIGEWINKLDKEEPVESEYEVVQLRYADPREVEDSVGEGFTDLPGTEFLPSILIQPLTETKQVIVFGRKDLREIVKRMIAEIDVPPGQFETAHIKLKHADPDTIKEKLDELYQEGMTTGISGRFGFYGGYNPYYRGRGGSSTSSSAMVKVVSYSSLKEITVIASPENMEEIRKRIAEWDVPLDVDSVKPRIIELRNCDPVEMANLLTSLFSDSGGGTGSTATTRARSMFNVMFASSTIEREKIVGALYGQLTFEEVPGTKKIIVISKIAEAYDVIEDLVRELDKEEMAEVPRVIPLKYADPEKLSEILNATFCEAGTSASLSRSETGLSQYSMDDEDTTSQDSGAQANYALWWAGSGARSSINEERPISNVIGRIRFVPDSRTKSILVLAPPEFVPDIERLIEELDTPGKQVMIKAVIVEVDHKNLSSLGVQLASNSGAFGELEENAVTALNVLQQLDTHGSAVFGASGAQGTVVTNSVTANVNVLLDFLVKKVNAKILNQQTLWTEDNEEASFFKGSNVAFYTAATTGTGTSTQNFEFQRVGMNLAVRPSITPNKDVDMVINIIISQLTSDRESGQPVRTEMETQTNMIIGDGQTLMLGGILFQQDGVVRRKVPLLGDIPVLGGLFSHKETTEVNNEMLVFITPYVIDDDFENLAPATKEQIEVPKQKLEDIRGQLDATMEALD